MSLWKMENVIIIVSIHRHTLPVCREGYSRIHKTIVSCYATHTMMQWSIPLFSGNFPSSGWRMLFGAESETGKYQKCSSFYYGSWKQDFLNKMHSCAIKDSVTHGIFSFTSRTVLTLFQECVWQWTLSA